MNIYLNIWTQNLIFSSDLHLNIDYVFGTAETACLSGLFPYTDACVYLHAFYICGWSLQAAVGQPRWTFMANIKVLSCLFQIPFISCPHLVTSG